MNARIAERWASVNDYPEIPGVQLPRWAARIVDADQEILGVHKDTGAPFPLSLHDDLDPGDRAVVVVRRILKAGGTPAECQRFLRAFSLPDHVLGRLLHLLGEATR